MAYIGQEPVNTFSPVPSKDSFTGDGSTTAFDLANVVVSGAQNALEVFIDNVRQEPGSGKAFTLGFDGSNDLRRITFTAAPANGAAIYVINDKTSSVSIISPQDLNGVELILDADADTSITADTDDRIDFKIANTDHIQLGTSSGDTTIKIATDAKDLQFLQADGRNILEINDAGYVALGNGATGSGQLRIYEDTDNGTNFSAFQVGTQSADITYTLPTADGTSGFQLTTNGSGTLSWAAAEIALANDGNNRIVTGTGSASLNAEANLTFDGSTLALTGAVTVSTNLDVDGTTNLDAVDIDGAVQIDATLSVGVDDTGYDVKLFGDTASAFMLWDASADDLILSGAAGLIVPEGQLTLGSTAITLTAAELNILDGDNNASSVTLADADRIIVNDNGTMKQVAVSALNTYTSASIAADDITVGDAAVNITTSSGNITIDAAASDSDVIFKGTDGGADITMLTLDGSADGAAIFKSTVTTTGLVIGSTAVTTTPAELNLIDGGTSRGTTAVADGDGILINDAGTMRMTTVQTVSTYMAAESVGGGNMVTVGALDSGSITSGFGNIDNGASNITSGGLVKLDVDTDADDVSGDSATGRLTLGASQDLNLYHGGTHSYIVNDTGNLVIDTAGDLTFDAAGNDFKFLANGTEILNITNSSSDVIIKPLVDAKDIIFQQRDGTEVARIEDNATFNVSVAGKFAYAGVAVTSTAAELNLLDTASANSVVNSKAVIYGSSGELAGTLSTAAQANVTSLGTLTTLTVDNIITNGTTIGHTDDTDLITLADGVVTIAGNVVVSGTVRAEGGELTTTGKALVFGF